MDLVTASTVEVYDRALGVASRIAEWRPMLDAAVFSWLQPFPMPIYLFHDAIDPTLPSAPGTLARAATELAGRNGDFDGDWIDFEGRPAAYEGPDPLLFPYIVPPYLERTTHREWRRWLPHILTAMELSQLPRYVPNPDQRIRLSVITGAQPLPQKYLERALPIELKTNEWPRELKVATPSAAAARRELGRRIGRWIWVERESVYFQSLDALTLTPVDALSVGREILARFLSAEHVQTEIPWPARSVHMVPASEATSTKSTKSRRRPPAAVDASLGTFTRDLIIDAIATGRVRLSHQSGPELAHLPVLGRVHDDAFYVVPKVAHELVESSGLMSGSTLQIARSLNAAGWLHQPADGTWTIPRRVDDHLTRVWSLPIEILGSVHENEFAPTRYPVREYRMDVQVISDIQSVIRAALISGEAVLEAPSVEGQDAVELGRVKGDRVLIIPSAARQLLQRHQVRNVGPKTIGRALGQAGWIERPIDGAWTVFRRLDGKGMRVWNLPLSFLEGTGVKPSDSAR